MPYLKTYPAFSWQKRVGVIIGYSARGGYKGGKATHLYILLYHEQVTAYFQKLSVTQNVSDVQDHPAGYIMKTAYMYSMNSFSFTHFIKT